jgi:hypothetical protein
MTQSNTSTSSLSPLKDPCKDQESSSKKIAVSNIDYPRPLRISSLDGSIEKTRKTLRLNMIAHQNYVPNLDSIKSRLLLEGVY